MLGTDKDVHLKSARIEKSAPIEGQRNRARLMLIL